jgi:hypothetical protein
MASLRRPRDELRLCNKRCKERRRRQQFERQDPQDDDVSRYLASRPELIFEPFPRADGARVEKIAKPHYGRTGGSKAFFNRLAGSLGKSDAGEVESERSAGRGGLAMQEATARPSRA